MAAAKSTLLEAIAECCGFNPEGGNRDHHRAVFADRSPLAQAFLRIIHDLTTPGHAQFLITRDFLNSPDRFFKHLFETVEDTGTDA